MPFGGAARSEELFTVWTLTAQIPLGVKWFDSGRGADEAPLGAAHEPAHADRRRNAAMGQAGMPDAIRTTVEGLGAHPPTACLCAAGEGKTPPRTRRGTCDFRRAVVGAPFGLLLALRAGRADETAPAADISTVDAYVAAFMQLDRHGIAALALTLGILCFAVVTAILLVRTRRRLSETEAMARDESIAARASVDRAYALLLTEPQVLIAWAAAADEPEIIGDPSSV